MAARHPVQGGRRAFFRQLFGLGVAAGAGAWIARRGSPAQPAQASVTPAGKTAYRETDHIRKYYHSARG